jgi:hypothetical protein
LKATTRRLASKTKNPCGRVSQIALKVSASTDKPAGFVFPPSLSGLIPAAPWVCLTTLASPEFAIPPILALGLRRWPSTPIVNEQID